MGTTYIYIHLMYSSVKGARFGNDFILLLQQVLDRAELDAACLDVIRMTLDLDCGTCRESALHGLGHCYFEYPTQAKAIISRFLDRHPGLRAELRVYAWAALAGRVQ